MFNRTLTRYINSIVDDYYFNDSGTRMPKLLYYGDGCGDFEKTGDDASEMLLENYIQYCNKQLIIAEAALKRKQDERNDGKTEEE